MTDDYRGICINPVLSNMFEHCQLVIFSKALETSSFGFKAKLSCNHVVYSVQKTIEYFIENESTVNVCALDLQKAFDKTNSHSLFIKLINRNCPMKLINH